MEDLGWIKIHRKILENGILAHPNAFTLFIYFIVRASRLGGNAPTQNGIVALKPGQCVTGRNKLIKDCGMSAQNVRTALAFLEKYKYLTITPTKGYSIITVVNYEKYQHSDGGVTNHLTKTQPRPNQDLTTIQECIESKNTISTPTQPFTDSFYAAYEQKYNVRPSPPKHAFILLASKVRAGLALEDWEACIKNYFSAKWVTAHSLEMLVTKLDTFRIAAKKKQQTFI